MKSRDYYEYHGHSMSKTYVSWLSMKQRCYNPNRAGYHRYGGRGIRVCERWLTSFKNFLEDMGERPEGKTLDRKNNDRDYSKTNCRWATPTEQRKNQRKG